MTPGARLAAAIELAHEIEAAPPPADTVVNGFFRRRRYAGGGDRRAISTDVFRTLRHRARLDWWIERAGAEIPPASRSRLIAAQILIEGRSPGEIGALFSGDRYCPTPLDPAEIALATALEGKSLTDEAMPASVRLEIPDWLLEPIERAWGDGLEDEMAALNREAPVDLRINALAATREEALAALARDGIEAAPTPHSPLGLRLGGRTALGGSAAFRDGLVEVQDEGSQIAALLVGAGPAMAVCDLCAGTGGKTLALAGTMAGGGEDGSRLVACDTHQGRLGRLLRRLERAGARNVGTHVLTDPTDPWRTENVEEFDRILADVPCSGSGTWRRNPDARWRLTADDLAAYATGQADILEGAALLVKPGGRLVYVTCSILREENEDVIESFLAGTPDFAPVQADAEWTQVLGTPCPVGGPFLRLSPATTGTDGFFVAILERKSHA